MKKIVFVIVFISSILSVANLYSKEILNLKWGEDPHNINYFTVPDGRYGVVDFYVDGDEIGILDKFNYKIHIFNNSQYKYSIENIPDGASFLERYFKKTYIFTQDSSVYQIQNNTPVVIQRFDKRDNLTSVIFFNNVFYPVYNFEKYTDNNRLMDAIIENPHLAQIRVYEDNSMYIFSFASSEEIAAITPVGISNNGLMVILVEYSGGSRRAIETIDYKGNSYSSIGLPIQFFINGVREVKIFNNDIYILATDQYGLTIYKFNSFEGGNITISEWRKKFFENFEVHIPDQTPLLALTSVKRSEALALAKQYNDHVWTAKSCNVGTTTCTDWCNKQKTIKPPSWVVVGTNSRFPYSWGGFSSISQFDQGITDCKKAGDIQTKYANGTSACGSSCSVGVDCSGFVSRLWKQTTKYGTSTIMQIATKINKSDLKPADALNDAGSHIRLFVGFRPDGKWDMVESYAGSGYWGVGYTVRTPSENNGYDAIRYNAIVDDSVPTNKPPVINHTPVTTAEQGKDIIITAKITDDGGKIASATLRFKNEGETNLTAVNMTDKGSGNFEATISASSIKSSKIYYYLAAWDGESPVETGVNRSILPEKAEDLSPVYFTVKVITNKPPVINHTPVTTAEQGKDIIITAKITDDGGKIASATLRFKNEGKINFTTVNMTDKGSGNFEATISASSIKSSKIYYYLAAWDGESPIETGVNRSILPEKAEDLFPVYFTVKVITNPQDAGVDTGYQDITSNTTKDIISDTAIRDEENSNDTGNSVDDAPLADIVNLSDEHSIMVDDITTYEDIKKRTTDLSKLSDESDSGGCGCTFLY